MATIVADYTELYKMMRNMSQLGGATEDTIKRVMHDKATHDTLGKDVSSYIRESKMPRVKGRPHARDKKWWIAKKSKLSFELISKGGAANLKKYAEGVKKRQRHGKDTYPPNAYGYLIFPDEGRGDKNPVAQRFGERGLAKGSVLRILEQELQIDIDKTINGG